MLINTSSSVTDDLFRTVNSPLQARRLWADIRLAQAKGYFAATRAADFGFRPGTIKVDPQITNTAQIHRRLTISS